jgi:tRNA nucleotidyltransferase (CCA-adding enzyme)
MKIFLVGGAVRDQLLNFPYTEKDWVVVGSSPEAMLKLGYTPVGKDFPVFLHPQTHEEYALARTERKTAPGYKGFIFHTAEDVSLEEDLQRRDLTINAIAQDKNGKIIDPCHGVEDIKHKWLRHTSPAFSEDPVRVLRVARFAARYYHLGFRVADETLAAMRTMVEKKETQHLVPERVWQECNKAFSEKNPEQFFATLITCHAIADIFPSLAHINLSENLHHLVSASLSSSDTIIRFAAFCFPLTLAQIETLCQQLTTPNDYRELAILSRKYFPHYQQTTQWTPNTLADLFQYTDALRKPQRFQQLLKTWASIKEEKDNTAVQLLDALAQYKDINHQTLMEQGYQKAALGEAIKGKRLEKLTLWLEKRSHYN